MVISNMCKYKMNLNELNLFPTSETLSLTEIKFKGQLLLLLIYFKDASNGKGDLFTFSKASHLIPLRNTFYCCAQSVLHKLIKKKCLMGKCSIVKW